MAPKSISDDDLCAVCVNCDYRAGQLSECVEAHGDQWPATFDRDGYAVDCPKFEEA